MPTRRRRPQRRLPRARALRAGASAMALAASLAAAMACGRSAGFPAPPSTQAVTVVDTLFGQPEADPFRWLESQDSEQVSRWISAQNAYADSLIGNTPLRQEITPRLRALMTAPNVGVPRRAGAWEYFTLRGTGDEVAAVYRRKAPANATPTPIDPKGSYEKVLDPLARRGDGTTSVEVQGFSPNGKLMLYSVRDGGPDEVTVHVRDLERASDLPDSLPWALYGSMSFDQQANGFYYVHRSREVGPRLKYHRLGTPLATDSVLFGDGYAPTAFLAVSFNDEGRKRLYTVGHGWARNDILLQDMTKGGEVTAVARDLPAHFTPQMIDGRLWMRTDLGAPRGRIVVVDPITSDTSRWHTVVPEGEDVIDGFSVIDGKLYVTYIHDVAHRLRRFRTDGAPDGEIEVPPLSSVSLRPYTKGKALMSVTSFTQPSVTYEVDLASGARKVWEASEVPFDSAGIEVRQVWYRTLDGKRAPMFVMHRRGLKLDGGTPALLTGYGGFAVSLLPRFDATAVLWVEQGGVFAQATLRGGNEFGEEWHRDGMLANKPNVFNDFIAAAQFLVDSGYTSPERFAIRGTSNGGLLMGAAVTKRPDLFRVAYIGNPDLDILRFPSFTTANNAPALLEYGDASKADEYRVIRTFSPYQNVRDGTRYPAMFIATGQNDTRVPPWAARKFAARVQAATTSGLPVILYNDLRQGHAGGRGMSASVEFNARQLDFLMRMVGMRARVAPD